MASEPQFSPVLDWGFVIQGSGKTFGVEVLDILIQCFFEVRNFTDTEIQN